MRSTYSLHGLPSPSATLDGVASGHSRSGFGGSSKLRILVEQNEFSGVVIGFHGRLGSNTHAQLNALGGKRAWIRREQAQGTKFYRAESR